MLIPWRVVIFMLYSRYQMSILKICIKMNTRKQTLSLCWPLDAIIVVYCLTRRTFWPWSSLVVAESYTCANEFGRYRMSYS